LPEVGIGVAAEVPSLSRRSQNVLPELDVEKVKRWCRDRVPAKFADQVRLEVTTRGKSIFIHECRPVWRGAR
jgi:hypothetical protein